MGRFPFKEEIRFCILVRSCQKARVQTHRLWHAMTLPAKLWQTSGTHIKMTMFRVSMLAGILRNRLLVHGVEPQRHLSPVALCGCACQQLLTVIISCTLVNGILDVEL